MEGYALLPILSVRPESSFSCYCTDDVNGCCQQTARKKNVVDFFNIWYVVYARSFGLSKNTEMDTTAFYQLCKMIDELTKQTCLWNARGMGVCVVYCRICHGFQISQATEKVRVETIVQKDRLQFACVQRRAFYSMTWSSSQLFLLDTVFLERGHTSAWLTKCQTIESCIRTPSLQIGIWLPTIENLLEIDHVQLPIEGILIYNQVGLSTPPLGCNPMFDKSSPTYYLNYHQSHSESLSLEYWIWPLFLQYKTCSMPFSRL